MGPILAHPKSLAVGAGPVERSYLQVGYAILSSLVEVYAQHADIGVGFACGDGKKTGQGGFDDQRLDARMFLFDARRCRIPFDNRHSAPVKIGFCLNTINSRAPHNNERGGQINLGEVDEGLALGAVRHGQHQIQISLAHTGDNLRPAQVGHNFHRDPNWLLR